MRWLFQRRRWSGGGGNQCADGILAVFWKATRLRIFLRCEWTVSPFLQLFRYLGIELGSLKNNNMRSYRLISMFVVFFFAKITWIINSGKQVLNNEPGQFNFRFRSLHWAKASDSVDVEKCTQKHGWAKVVRRKKTSTKNKRFTWFVEDLVVISVQCRQNLMKVSKYESYNVDLQERLSNDESFISTIRSIFVPDVHDFVG